MMNLKFLLISAFVMICGTLNNFHLVSELFIEKNSKSVYTPDATIVLDREKRMEAGEFDILFRDYRFEILDFLKLQDDVFHVETVIISSDEPKNGMLVQHTLEFTRNYKDSLRISRHHIYTRNDVTKNPIKLALEEGRSVYGGFLTIPHPKVIENMAMSQKMDFIWIEAEHTEYGPKDSQNLVRTAQGVNTVPIIRVPINGVEEIKKYIGTGASGIIIPNIESLSDAQEAIDSCKYPPVGKRHAGAERANGYLANFKEYYETANRDMLVGIMIEKSSAVDNIDVLCNMTEIDVLHLGPLDLSLSLGVSQESQTFKQAVEKVEIAAEKYNKPLGCAANTYNDTYALKQKGYQFFTIPGDMTILQDGVTSFFEKKI